MLCIETNEELINDIDSQRFDIIMVENYRSINGLENLFPDTIDVNAAMYELRCILIIEYINDVKHNAEIFSRRENDYNKW